MIKEWEKLEEYVRNRLTEILPTYKTAGSGNRNNDADSKNEFWLAECKYTGRTDNINIRSKCIKKVEEQALKHSKEWILIHRSRKHTTVTLDFDIFIEILKGEFPRK